MALWLPRLPTDRLLRKSRSEAPLVVSHKANNALYIYGLNRQAQQLGLYKGQPLANARAMVQPLAIVPADEKADAALLEKIADWCDRFTPLVTLDSPDGLLLDITGAAHLFGGEAAMLTMATSLIAKLGFTVRGAIAGTSLTARALARHAANTIVPPGEEAAVIAPLSIIALDCDDKTLRALRHAGLKTIGMVAERQNSELTARLGKQFLTRLRILLGAEEQPLQPRRPLPDLMAEQRFAEPIVSEDSIATSLLGLAQSLSEIMEREGKGARLLEAAFFRADGKVERIAVRLGTALRDPQVMLRLLRQKLDALADPLDPGFGFDLIRLEAVLAEETNPVTVSFDSHENARAQVSFLVDRLAARFGDAQVLRFVPQDTHIPEAAGAAVPAQDRDFTNDEPWPVKRQAGDPPRRPLRLLQKPEQIRADFPVAPDGPPKFFTWRECRHEVARAEGPERIAMEWWKRKGLTRDYFRVETPAGQRFWLYRDGLYKEAGFKDCWFMHGIFA
jgi:protein ImuB